MTHDKPKSGQKYDGQADTPTRSEIGAMVSICGIVIGIIANEIPHDDLRLLGLLVCLLVFLGGGLLAR